MSTCRQVNEAFSQIAFANKILLNKPAPGPAQRGPAPSPGSPHAPMSTFRQLLDQLEVEKDAEVQGLKEALDAEVQQLRGGNEELKGEVSRLAANVDGLQEAVRQQQAKYEEKAQELQELEEQTGMEKRKLKAQIGEVTKAAQLHANQLLTVARTAAKQLEADALKKAKEVEKQALLKAQQVEQEAQSKVQQVQAEIAKAKEVLRSEKQRQDQARETLAKEAAMQVKDRHQLNQLSKKQEWDQASVSAASTQDTTEAQWEPAVQPWQCPPMQGPPMWDCLPMQAQDYTGYEDYTAYDCYNAECYDYQGGMSDQQGGMDMGGCVYYS